LYILAVDSNINTNHSNINNNNITHQQQKQQEQEQEQQPTNQPSNQPSNQPTNQTTKQLRSDFGTGRGMERAQCGWVIHNQDSSAAHSVGARVGGPAAGWLGQRLGRRSRTSTSCA
jgi:hypothetical protein